MTFKKGEKSILRKWIIIFTVLFVSFIQTELAFAHGSTMRDDKDQQIEKDHKHHHKLIEEEQVNELMKQGFTKKEIFLGAIISKKANKKVEEVLAIYKKNQSWEQTATQLGLSSEEVNKILSMHKWEIFVKENKDEIIEHLATYANKSEDDIHAYLKDKISLRFLIGAAAVAKLTNKDLDEIITLKKEQKSFHEIMKDLNVNHEDLHKEIRKFKQDVEKAIEEDTED